MVYLLVRRLVSGWCSRQRHRLTLALAGQGITDTDCRNSPSATASDGAHGRLRGLLLCQWCTPAYTCRTPAVHLLYTCCIPPYRPAVYLRTPTSTDQYRHRPTTDQYRHRPTTDTVHLPYRPVVQTRGTPLRTPVVQSLAARQSVQFWPSRPEHPRNGPCT